MSKTYRVMVVKYGYADVTAESEDDALHAVNSMRDADFDWCSDYSADDAQIVEDYDYSDLMKE